MFGNGNTDFGVHGMDAGFGFLGMGFHGTITLIFFALIAVGFALLLSDWVQDRHGNGH